MTWRTRRPARMPWMVGQAIELLRNEAGKNSAMHKKNGRLTCQRGLCEREISMHTSQKMDKHTEQT